MAQVIVNLKRGLNPYSNGRYSMSVIHNQIYNVNLGLNPYSNGRYSMGWPGSYIRWNGLVLILILLEDTL